MFDEYRPFGMGKTPRGRVKADKAAVMAKIAEENGSGAGKLRIKRTGRTAIVWAACIAAVSVMTVSAAATGVIDFNTLFGKFFVTDSSELSNSLMKSVKNVECETNDSDYIIEFKGAAGDETNIIVAAEIRRADGTPVKDHFLVQTDGDKFIDPWTRRTASAYGDETGGFCFFSLNENGNIDIYAKMTEIRSLNGSRMTIESNKLYAFDRYWEYKNSGNDDENGYTVLNLGWRIAFDYQIPEDSIVTKSCGAQSRTFPYYLNLIEKKDENHYEIVEEFESQARVTAFEAGAFSARMTFEFDLTGNNKIAREDPDNRFSVGLSTENQNTIYLIKKDGTTMPMLLSQGTTSFDGDVQKNDYFFSYGDDYKMQKLVDIESATAVCVNGTVYKIS